MATIADLLVKIGADTSDLRKELNATKRQIKSAFGSEALDMSKKSLAVLGGIGAGLAALGVASVKAGASLQSTKTAFTNMLGSAEKAQNFLGKMQDFAAKTPFEFSQVSQAAQKFIAFGFSAEQVIPTLTAVGDAAAGVGLGAEGINRITLALGQMAAKSKVQAGEMMQLTETGIPAWKMLADQIGVSVPEAMSMVSKGAIDAATGITALVSGMEQSFGGMMDQQSQTISGTWSTLMDGLEQSAAQVGLQIAEALNLTGLFQSLGDILTNFAATVQSSGLTEALLTAIPPEFQAGIILIVSTLTGLAIPAIGLLVTKVTLMAAPFMAAVTAAAPFIAVAAAGTGGMEMSFSVVQNRIRLVRGDSAEIRLVICDRVTGEPFIPGKRDELTFTLKRSLTDERPVLTKTLEQGIRQEGAECFLVFWPDDTRRLSCGRYVYDVELVRENGYTDTLIPPRPFFLERGVTDDGA